ncbi:MAG: nitroreductase family protein [Natronospirillum sp.]|uniref:nitroreductase family protein n=1 Tax=Natronospirillum sp. TaxID=2812955 RepID=UPI0025FEAB5F|nr:nitroreductase family protein [Natronospirillum sp.]MCH8553120.1 nitroreductase family protein [Natronospirillum sp.]
MATAVLEQLLARSSMPRLAAPAPDDMQLDQVLRAGLLAPDHAYLRPTRLHVVTEDGLVRLGDLFARAFLDSDPDATEKALDKARGKPLRAPMIIVACCHPSEHDKVPAIEQIASTAACVSLMQTALDSLGYGSMWRTGPMAYHPLVREQFGLTDQDHLLAFLYVGTAKGKPRVREQKQLDDYCRRF